MSSYFYKVAAIKDHGKLAIGMFIEVVTRNASRTPTQKEILDAINLKYGANTTPNGLSLNNFMISKG